MKICLIHIYLGKLPVWFSSFAKTCNANQDINFLFLTDDLSHNYTSTNIKNVKFSKKDFNQLAKEKLCIEPSLLHPYKLCDFKPAFGKLFEDYLTTYDFWGYCDNDMLLGDISRYLPVDMLENIDVLSTESDFMAGPFSIFRNSAAVNNLYMKISNFRYYLEFPEYQALDENFKSPISILDKAIFKIKSLPFLKHGSKYRVEQFKYFWREKKKNLNKNNLLDFTEVIWAEEIYNHLRVSFLQLIKSDRSMARAKEKSIQIVWKDSKLLDLLKNKEYFAFHFLDSKSLIEDRQEILFEKDEKIYFKKC